ncbi:peptide-N-glycosidase F-related protein [Seonamhaeicola sp. MEBiC1930]|uniref:T9SS type A sorting domain-containing protein n=1 Tax=Seonamhaeicola sp. MEBiC01930 TaxID=2976768 RepID=UPI00324AD8DA
MKKNNSINIIILALLLVVSSNSLGQTELASFNYLNKPSEIHPDGTLATSSPITFEISNFPTDADNIIRLRLFRYPNADPLTAFDNNGDAINDNVNWTGSDSNRKINMYLGLLNDSDATNSFYRTETVTLPNGRLTKTYTIFNVSDDLNTNPDGSDIPTILNGGLEDGEHYAPIVIIVHANDQPRYNNSGNLGNGNGNNPLYVDQATLDQSPDIIATHLTFSYYPPEENATTGNGLFPHITANSDIDLLGNGSGQQNQIITFDPISRKSTNAAPFDVSASSTSGLTNITYTVESGPATINGNTVTLDDNAAHEDVVTLKAHQAGNAEFLEGEGFIQFEIVDVSLFSPTISTRLTEDYPLEMPALHAYPIYITTSVEEADLISINSIEVTVDGTPLTVVGENGLHYALWTPDDYGFHNVNIIAYGSNGVNTNITKNIEVTDNISTRNVPTMSDVVIEFNTENSRNFYGTFTMPQHIGSYNQIMANLVVECPSNDGDCDDWDRRAFIDVKGPDGNWIQIIRYITPYGVGCSHSIDLTDYASLLQGEVEFRMFIDTWGTGGWQISLNLSYQQGTPQYLYSNVDEVWDGFWDLGDPNNLQPIPVESYTYKTNVVSSHMRLSNTGHGWGSNNSQNAAEFYNATNYIDIDGVEYYTQNLWNDCNPNPDSCTGQLGTWTFSRAGWCPGTIAPPNIIDLTSQISKGNVDFRYRLDPTYVDECHPNNPSCITGVTCDDCNDGFNPRYHIDAQLINFSNTPLIQGTLNVEEINNTANYELRAYPNPSNGVFNISSEGLIGKSIMQVVSISGQILRTYVFDSAEEINNTTFDFSSLDKGLYFISIDNNAGHGNLKLVLD